MTIITRSLAVFLVAACFGNTALFAQDVPNLKKVIEGLIDTDGNGEISAEEGQAALRNVNKRAAAGDKIGDLILMALDADGNKNITQQELENAGSREKERKEAGKNNPAADIYARFDFLDIDKNNALTPDEFQKAIQLLGPLGQFLKPKYQQLFIAMDTNRDMIVTKAEVKFASDNFKQQEDAKTNAVYLKQAQQVVAQMDRNRNRKISIREAQDIFKDHFIEIDTNSNKSLSIEEVQQFIASGKAKAYAVAKATGANKPTFSAPDNNSGFFTPNQK